MAPSVGQVGPKKKNLKVKNFEEFQFRPRELVADICRIYIHLGGEERFCAAVSRDGRSYSHSLFEQAEQVLCKIHQSADTIATFGQLAVKIQVYNHNNNNNNNNNKHICIAP